MTEARRTLSSVLVYASVVAVLFGGVICALAAMMAFAAGLDQHAERTKSPLELRIESAREVRTALSKPIPASQPLPPITAKLEKPVAKVAAARPASRRTAMRQARQLFANVDPSPPPPPFFSFMAFGPR
jgi:hypothetical protein